MLKYHGVLRDGRESRLGGSSKMAMSGKLSANASTMNLMPGALTDFGKPLQQSKKKDKDRHFVSAVHFV